MAYTDVFIDTYNNPNNRSLWLPLNEERDGWVAQILNGTFGTNREYDFTGNVVTSMSEKQIDINMRLTPVVPVPAKPARYFLNNLSSSKIGKVRLLDSALTIPTIKYVHNETTTYTKPTVTIPPINEMHNLKQDCVIRELKYNYSESPATIEFTISTKQPILYSDEFTIYMGLGNQNWSQAVADVKRVISEIGSDIGEVDFRSLELSLPPVGTSIYNIFNLDFAMFKATLKGNSSTNPGKFSMYGLNDGTRRFSITGGYDSNAASCYALEAYPKFPLHQLNDWLSYLTPPPKIKLDNVGSGYAKLEMVPVRKGL
nr:MAG TPA: hypothetical protein [Caudoviricetes sp.]